MGRCRHWSDIKNICSLKNASIRIEDYWIAGKKFCPDAILIENDKKNQKIKFFNNYEVSARKCQKISYPNPVKDEYRLFQEKHNSPRSNCASNKPYNY